MSSQLIKLIKAFLFLAILNLSISQNIITSWHYDKVQMYDLQKIGTIISTQLKEKISTFDPFKVDDIEISDLQFVEVQHSLYDSYLNFNTGLLLFTPNKVTLSFNFTYSYQSESGKASFDLKINLLKMRLTNNKENQTQTVEVSMFSSEKDYSVFEIPDKELAAKVQTVLYKGFESNNILNKIASKIDIINYYEEFYKNKKDLKFVTSTFFDSKKVSISFNRFIGFCEDVTGQAESALCYYSGELDEEDKTDKTSVPISNEKFVNPNDTYNTFINMDLYNKIVAKILNEGLSEKILNKNTVKGSPNDFTLLSLKKIIKGLDNYGDDENFEIKIKIKELNSKLTKFIAIFNIGRKTNVFSLDFEIDINLKIEILKSVRFNICSDNVKNVKVNVKSGSIYILDESQLKKYVEKILDEEPICLTDEGISLRDYYSIITNGYCQEEGFYLEGNQLYQ